MTDNTQNAKLLIEEYAKLQTSISVFRARWQCVVAIEGELHLRPEAFGNLVSELNLDVTINKSDGTIHLHTSTEGCKLVTVLGTEFCPDKGE